MSSYAGYNPVVIEAFAKTLYDRADSLILRGAIYGFILGCIIGTPLGAAICQALHRDILAGALVGMIVGAGLLTQFAIGRARIRAFALYLQAQTALCQLEIEKNTRNKKGADAKEPDKIKGEDHVAVPRQLSDALP